jgi:tRNA U34 5-carboxymethylaminomethyl modifying enzyme MnmG/GidA
MDSSIWEISFPGGRSGEPASEALSNSLLKYGLKLGRSKLALLPELI